MPDSEHLEKASFFATTRWSVVLAARDVGAVDATLTLETLCKTCWRSLCGYARRRGFSPHGAEDVTQTCYARLLEKDCLQAMRRELGPFRAFLQMAFKRLLAKERDRASALQRGGGATHAQPAPPPSASRSSRRAFIHRSPRTAPAPDRYGQGDTASVDVNERSKLSPKLIWATPRPEMVEKTPVPAGAMTMQATFAEVVAAGCRRPIRIP